VKRRERRQRGRRRPGTLFRRTWSLQIGGQPTTMITDLGTKEREVRKMQRIIQLRFERIIARIWFHGYEYHSQAHWPKRHLLSSTLDVTPKDPLESVYAMSWQLESMTTFT
jgi:hypothetical protein